MGGLVLVGQGCAQLLDALRADWLPNLLVGLYTDEPAIGPKTTLANLTPCNFSGYDGLHDLVGWSAAVLLGDAAVSYATKRTWQHDGGSVAQYVTGYYVVDRLGSTLLWAQDLPTSILMSQLGNAVDVAPAFTIGSRY